MAPAKIGTPSHDSPTDPVSGSWYVPMKPPAAACSAYVPNRIGRASRITADESPAPNSIGRPWIRLPASSSYGKVIWLAARSYDRKSVVSGKRADVEGL